MRLASEIFIENLKNIRKAKGFTQTQLAVMADVSSGMIGDIESGRRNPTLITIEKIALALEVPVQQLFHDSLENYPDSILSSKEELRELLHSLIDKAIDE